MENFDQKAYEIVSKLSEEQKARLVCGKNYWESECLPELSLSSFVMADGPHGLRRQGEEADYTGIHPSAPAVCYPTASLAACSFDPKLMKEMGQALGEECLEQGVHVLLGPGINHKRVPWCGRSFEYFSEDPVLTSALASGWINGLQSCTVMAALKHFACNSQENYRMTQDSLIDERAFRELYTSAFEKTIRASEPAFIMTSYNKINGVYASENQKLMDLGRYAGFQGAYMTDWGSLNDPQASFEAGTDLEMPGLSKGSSRIVLEKVSRKRRDEIAFQIVKAMLKAKAQIKMPFDPEKQEARLALSERIAGESMVLLKNEDTLLPLKKDAKTAVIGALAKHSRIQGAGSSKVNAAEHWNLYEALQEEGIDFDYASGCRLDGSTDEALLAQARETARNKDTVILVLGLPEIMESEGYDRTDLKMPEGFLSLFDAVYSMNKNIAVVLQTGGVVELPFENKAKAILLSYLSGGRGQKAASGILSGRINPSGHLAETWVKKTEDVPVQQENKEVFYRESIYSGYRYYEAYRIPVVFPFGHGLSYTDFTLGVLHAETADHQIIVRITVTNTGAVFGGTALQIYMHPECHGIHRPPLELKAFEKVFLAPGETKDLEFILPVKDFAYYDMKKQDWIVEEGIYEILAGFSSQDLSRKAEIFLSGEKPAAETQYFPGRDLKHISAREYCDYAGIDLPVHEQRKEIDQNTTIEDLCRKSRVLNFLFSRIIQHVVKKEKNEGNKKILEVTISQMPVRLLGMYGLSKQQIEAVVDLLNHRFFAAVKKVLS